MWHSVASYKCLSHARITDTYYKISSIIRRRSVLLVLDIEICWMQYIEFTSTFRKIWNWKLNKLWRVEKSVQECTPEINQDYSVTLYSKRNWNFKINLISIVFRTLTKESCIRKKSFYMETFMNQPKPSGNYIRRCMFCILFRLVLHMPQLFFAVLL